MKKTVSLLIISLISSTLIWCGEKKLPKWEFDMEQWVLIMPDVDGEEMDIEE